MALWEVDGVTTRPIGRSAQNIADLLALVLHDGKTDLSMLSVHSAP